jgi:hypothetical protein
MSTIEAALRGSAVALLTLLALAGLRDRWRTWASRYGALLATSVAAYAIQSAPDPRLQAAWVIPLRLIGIGTPAVFWLWAAACFDDEFRPSWSKILPWVALVALGALRIFGGWPGSSSTACSAPCASSATSSLAVMAWSSRCARTTPCGSPSTNGSRWRAIYGRCAIGATLGGRCSARPRSPYAINPQGVIGGYRGYRRLEDFPVNSGIQASTGKFWRFCRQGFPGSVNNFPVRPAREIDL